MNKHRQFLKITKELWEHLCVLALSHHTLVKTLSFSLLFEDFMLMIYRKHEPGVKKDKSILLY